MKGGIQKGNEIHRGGDVDSLAGQEAMSMDEDTTLHPFEVEWIGQAVRKHREQLNHGADGQQDDGHHGDPGSPVPSG